LFNEANLLERVDVWLERVAEPAGLLDPAVEAPTPVGVADIDYDAKGQRTLIDYKTRDATVIRISYAYDRETFRLLHLYTRRGVDPNTSQGVAFADDCENPNPPPVNIAAPAQPPAGKGCGLQNLHYTYDPAGNITHIRDDAQQTVYFRNRRVEPSNDYIYDALYRLIQADGREHLGQAAGGERLPPTAPDGFNAFHTRLDHPGDGNAMGTYTERYVYDAVGNLLQMQHRGSDPAHAGWTRSYAYGETSLTEPGKQSNRLSSSQVGNVVAAAPEIYRHDAHGNMLRMPHLGRGTAGPNMHWDYKDQLRQTDLGGGGTAFYVYDASGQRVRKVWEKAPGLIEERIYLGGFEIFRKHGGAIGANTATLEREALHVMDDKQRIALIETRTLDTAGNDPAPRQLIRYQFGNHLGSASLELDERAQIIFYEEYAPYGSSTYQAARSQTEMAKRYRFTGKELDEETGLSYHGQRYYSPWLGRWTSCDPSGLASDLNLYAYCLCNPVINIDPSGLENIVVVGSQHDEGAGNHLMFAHQGISKVLDYRNHENKELTTLVIFREGYTKNQLDAIEKEVRKAGAGFQVLDSANDLFSYVNRGVLANESGPSNRQADRVSNLDFFSHGVVGAVEFGYRTSKENEYRLDASNVSRFDSNAFGKDESPERPDNISSYACRTALGTFDYDVSHNTFEQEMGWQPREYRYDFKVAQSLAQRLADATNTDTVGFYVRTQYTETLGSSQDRRSSCTSDLLRLGCSQSPALKESMTRRRDVDGATFDPHGAMHPARKGDMPYGLENQSGAVLVRPKSRGMPIRAYSPPSY
jgi:RHS repeat-associated protein